MAQPVRADASHASGRRRDCNSRSERLFWATDSQGLGSPSFCPHHLRPCGVAESTRLPFMQKITGAKPVRDANFNTPKAFSAMLSPGKRVSSVHCNSRSERL